MTKQRIEKIKINFCQHLKKSIEYFKKFGCQEISSINALFIFFLKVLLAHG